MLLHRNHHVEWDWGQCLRYTSYTSNWPQAPWLEPCFDLDSLFYFLRFDFPLHFSCCFAWYLASQTQLPIFPNTSIPSPFPLPLHPQSCFLSHHWPPPPEQTAAADRRGAWEVQPTRQANSYLTSHLAADRHGGSVQVYTTHPISQRPPLSPCRVRSVS